MDTNVREVGHKVPGFGYKVQRSDTKFKVGGAHRRVQAAKGQTQRVSGLNWEGQGLTGAAQNGLGIDERVQDNVHERAHSPKGVQRPETDVCARIRRARASLWGSMR